jgi:glycosyltransferase involved in cell wall biosynthesis
MEKNTVKKRILFISAFFPNKIEPNIATYNKQQLISLTKYYDIDAIVPIPWYKRVLSNKYNYEGYLKSINILYPNYYYTPLIFRSIYGYFYYRSIRKSLNLLLDKNKYDYIYSSWLYPDAWAAKKIAIKIDTPLFVSVLGSDVNRLTNTSSLTKKSLEVGDYVTKIICVSNALRDKLISLKFDPNILTFLQNGINTEIFNPKNKSKIRTNYGIGKDDKIILFVGNLKKEKGLIELSDSFRNIINKNIYENIKLIIIGKGNYYKKTKKLLKKLKVIDKVDFMGQRSLEEISVYMNICDVLCLPSYSEGQPNVVIEALSCHTKVVSTTVGGIPELDTGHGNIKLVPPKDSLQLTDALIEMLDKPSVENSWPSFGSWDDNAAKLRDIFEDHMELAK